MYIHCDVKDLIDLKERLTLTGGNAPVTRVTNVMLSTLRISQQCLSALTEDSRVLMAEVERA